jgi:tRNA(Ile)-lysidine synthase TilS/MesJ
MIPEDEEEETLHHKNIRKIADEQLNTRDNTEFTQKEIKQTIEGFNDKKAPGIDGITSGIFLRTFNKYPRLVTAIYNQCLRRGQFPSDTNHPYNKTWQRKLYGTIQISPDNSAQHWRENIRETAYE